MMLQLPRRRWTLLWRLRLLLLRLSLLLLLRMPRRDLSFILRIDDM